MEITWLGHSCFRLKGKGATLLTDPFDASTGYVLGRPTADVVTVSVDLPDHNQVGDVAGEPTVIDGPGEYEVAGVLITGISSPAAGAPPGRNTVYVMEMDDLRLCHLGDLARVPKNDLVEAVGAVDVLMVPVGGHDTMDASQALETISFLQPKVVIPMHYRTSLFGPDLEPLDRFLREMGVKEPVLQNKLNVTRAGLPETTQVIVMEPKAL
ncbi:MAG: MBL fold metallo-hydrolase [Dehalococcoidia bacterium]|nr:MBL fold metallo-hydrolase [Dehalococcoidia bacterium]